MSCVHGFDCNNLSSLVLLYLFPCLVFVLSLLSGASFLIGSDKNSIHVTTNYGGKSRSTQRVPTCLAHECCRNNQGRRPFQPCVNKTIWSF